MKRFTFPMVMILSILFCANLNAQWDSLGDDIIPGGHRIWSIKVAPDRSVWSIATFDAFPPSGQTPKVLRSTDEGSTWDTLEIDEAVSSYAWDISPIDSLNAFVALDGLGLFQTINGGQSWSKVESFIHGPFYVHFFNEQEGWVLAGHNITSGLVMCVTEDGGNTWSYISNNDDNPPGTSFPPPANESLLAFAYSVNSAYDYDENSIVVGTTAGNYWISNDKGKNWERKRTPFVTLELNTTNIAMKDENTIMILSDVEQETYAGTEAVNFATTDGGETWVEGSSGLTAAATHYIPNSDSIFVTVGHNSFGWGREGTAISYDYGQNWELINNQSMIAIDFIDENTGFGGCCNNGWQTANGQIHKWNFELPTATKEIVESNLVKVMPNPVSTILSVETNGEFEADDILIEIISTNGAIVSKYQTSNNTILEIPVIDLVEGVYSLKISEKNKTLVKKFIKI